MFLKSITLTNFLSYGDVKSAIELRPLNVIIGPNGSGKSNLIEAIELLRATPKDILTPIRDGGGVRDWLWKGQSRPPAVAAIDAVVAYPHNPAALRYVLSFTEIAQRFEIVDEKVENESPYPGHLQPYFYYHFENGHGVLNVKGSERRLQHEDMDCTASILSQRKDPDQYPELTYLGNTFAKMRLYREWSFGRYTAPRLPQKADLPNEYLEPDGSNLGLVLNRLRREPAVKSGCWAICERFTKESMTSTCRSKGEPYRCSSMRDATPCRQPDSLMAHYDIFACSPYFAIQPQGRWYALKNQNWACTQMFYPRLRHF